MHGQQQQQRKHVWTPWHPPPAGEYFDLNLRRPPYNLDKPLAVFAENNPQFAPKFQVGGRPGGSG